MAGTLRLRLDLGSLWRHGRPQHQIPCILNRSFGSVDTAAFGLQIQTVRTGLSFCFNLSSSATWRPYRLQRPSPWAPRSPWLAIAAAVSPSRNPRHRNAERKVGDEIRDPCPSRLPESFLRAGATAWSRAAGGPPSPSRRAPAPFRSARYAVTLPFASFFRFVKCVFACY